MRKIIAVERIVMKEKRNLINEQVLIDFINDDDKTQPIYEQLKSNIEILNLIDADEDKRLF